MPYQRFRIVTVEIICLLYVLLFIYAATSKLLDMDNFQMQLGQSPLLSAFAKWVSYLVPFIEILTVLLLLIPKYRTAGLYCCFSLMTMFTAYIYIILNYSIFVPCSCGGILENMGWSEHLIFNICFLALAVVAIFMSVAKRNGTRAEQKKTAVALCSSLAMSIGLVALLFLLSEDIIHNRNSFIRRFPPHPVTLVDQLDLKLNSYYVAGLDSEHIYLGNVTAPLHIRVLNHQLETVEESEIGLPNLELPFRSPTLRVSYPDFYFMDGTVPVLFKGKAGRWKQTTENKPKAFFSLVAPLDSTTFAIRARDSRTNENILGLLEIGKTPSLELSKDVLVKQIDGVFDTDGMLLYNKQLDIILYTYFYRNQFVVTDNRLNLKHSGKTIDTISRAQLKVNHRNDSEKTSHLSAPPLLVNKSTATYGDYLFVSSALLGQFESKESFRKSSVIDVYDLVKNTYAFSFYIPHRDKDRMSEFYVQGDTLVCIIGEYILTYRLGHDFFKLPGKTLKQKNE